MSGRGGHRTNGPSGGVSFNGRGSSTKRSQRSEESPSGGRNSGDDRNYDDDRGYNRRIGSGRSGGERKPTADELADYRRTQYEQRGMQYNGDNGYYTARSTHGGHSRGYESYLVENSNMGQRREGGSYGTFVQMRGTGVSRSAELVTGPPRLSRETSCDLSQSHSGVVGTNCMPASSPALSKAATPSLNESTLKLLLLKQMVQELLAAGRLSRRNGGIMLNCIDDELQPGRTEPIVVFRPETGERGLPDVKLTVFKAESEESCDMYGDAQLEGPLVIPVGDEDDDDNHDDDDDDNHRDHRHAVRERPSRGHGGPSRGRGGMRFRAAPSTALKGQQSSRRFVNNAASDNETSSSISDSGGRSSVDSDDDDVDDRSSSPATLSRPGPLSKTETIKKGAKKLNPSKKSSRSFGHKSKRVEKSSSRERYKDMRRVGQTEAGKTRKLDDNHRREPSKNVDTKNLSSENRVRVGGIKSSSSKRDDSRKDQLKNLASKGSKFINTDAKKPTNEANSENKRLESGGVKKCKSKGRKRKRRRSDRDSDNSASMGSQSDEDEPRPASRLSAASKVDVSYDGLAGRDVEGSDETNLPKSKRICTPPEIKSKKKKVPTATLR